MVWMTRWCQMAVLGASLMGAGCNIAGTSKQEDLGQGIVRGTLGLHVTLQTFTWLWCWHGRQFSWRRGQLQDNT